MDPTAMLLPIINAALHDWGLWSIVPMALIVIGYEIRRSALAKDEEIATLRRQIADLQEKRLADAREMIRIAESGTEATAKRAQSDQRFADMLEAALRREPRTLFGLRR